LQNFIYAVITNKTLIKNIMTYWFKQNLIPTNIFGILSYLAFIAFNIFNFGFHSQTRYAGTGYWVYAIIGLLLSFAILAVLIYVKRQNNAVTVKTTQPTKYSTNVDAADYNTANMAVSKVSEKDDLKQVEGIGVAIEKLLNEAGILTFAALADAELSTVQAILTKGGPRFRMHSGESWGNQAALARDGKWVELNQLKDKLIGGGIRA
jgi:predicted flap endonuclease-1-like 5' DNA nuclease